MKILYRRKFKKLREEYADIGDVKLDLIEEAAKKSINSSSTYIGTNVKINVNLDNIDDTELTRSAEYFFKYRSLLKKRDDVRSGLAIGGFTAFMGAFLWKTVSVCKNNSTLAQEYEKGKADCYDNIEQYCRDNGCKDSWIGDTADGKHMILRISDEETEDYKAFHDTLDEIDKLEEYDEI